LDSNKYLLDFGSQIKYTVLLIVRVEKSIVKSRDESIFDKRKVENNAIDYRLSITNR